MFIPNVSITPLPAEELNELYAAFFTEFVFTPLPAEKLNELCAAFLTEFVNYSLTSKGIKINFMLRFLLNLSTTPLPAKELK